MLTLKRFCLTTNEKYAFRKDCHRCQVRSITDTRKLTKLQEKLPTTVTLKEQCGLLKHVICNEHVVKKILSSQVVNV